MCRMHEILTLNFSILPPESNLSENEKDIQVENGSMDTNIREGWEYILACEFPKQGRS